MFDVEGLEKYFLFQDVVYNLSSPANNPNLSKQLENYFFWIKHMKINSSNMLYDQIRQIQKKILFFQFETKKQNKKLMFSEELNLNKLIQYKSYKKNSSVDGVLNDYWTYLNNKNNDHYNQLIVIRDQIFHKINHLFSYIIKIDHFINIEYIYHQIINIMKSFDVFFIKHCLENLNHQSKQKIAMFLLLYFQFIKITTNFIHDKISDLYNKYILQQSIMTTYLKKNEHLEILKKHPELLAMIQLEFLKNNLWQNLNQKKYLTSYIGELQSLFVEVNNQPLLKQYILCVYIFILTHEQIVQYYSFTEEIMQIYQEQFQILEKFFD